MRFIIKFMLKLYYKMNPDILTWTIPVDEITDINIIIEKSYSDKREFGTRTDLYEMGVTMIDEKKLIEEIKEKLYPERFGERCNSLDVINAFMQLIDEQPKIGEWILCSNRLPSKEECEDRRKFFQVTINTGNNTSLLMNFIYKKVNDEEVGEWLWLGNTSPWEVIAWKPWDNEPYREVE